MLLLLVQSVTFLTGCVASLMALRRMWFFARSPHHLSKAMMHVFIQKAVASLGTMVFIVHALRGTWNGHPEVDVINPYLGALIRFAIFATAIRAMSHVNRSVAQVVNGND